MRVSVGSKIAFGFALAWALSAAIGMVSYATFNEFSRITAESDRNSENLERLTILSEHLTDIETGQRGFIITGDTSFLDPYNASLSLIDSDIRLLHEYFRKDPVQDERLSEIEPLITRRIDLARQGIELRRQNGVDRAALFLSEGEGKTVMDDLRRRIGEMRTIEESAMKSRDAFAPTIAFRAKTIIAAGSLLTLTIVMLGGIIIRHDFIRRNRAEAAQREAEERYRNLVENSVDGIFQTTPSGQIASSNPAWARLLGYDSPAELMRNLKNTTDIWVDPMQREHFKTQLAAGEINNYEMQFIRRDGQIRWCSANARRVQAPDGSYFFQGTASDITERKQLEAEKARLSHYIALLLDSTGEGIYGVDLQGNCTFINKAALKTLGYERQELMGRNLHAAIHHSHSDGTPYPEEECPVMKSILLRDGIRTDDEVLWRKDSQPFPVEYLSFPILENGTVSGAVITFTDITARRALQAELHRKNKELSEQNRRVEEANRLKSVFLANMSHELRTPLNAIIGFAEIMSDGHSGTVSVEQKEFLDDILTSARHLLQLINDVLDLSKVEAGKMELRPAHLRIDKLISEVRDIVRGLAAEKHIRIDAEIHGVDEVFLDPAKLKQVLYNFVSNALKFTPEGGWISIRAELFEYSSFKLEVEDSGIGIKPEDVDLLFQEFQQIDQGLTRKYQGTGLGLALTKRIVEAQGGTVGVRTTPGQGSTFYAILPLVFQSIAPQIPKTRPLVFPDSQTMQILVIEDEKKDIEWITGILTQSGYATDVAETGQEAMEKSAERSYDAIILDLLLPDASGWDTLRQIRTVTPNGSTPVIVLSIAADAQRRDIPVHDYFVKPVEGGRLIESLKKAATHG